MMWELEDNALVSGLLYSSKMRDQVWLVSSFQSCDAEYTYSKSIVGLLDANFVHSVAKEQDVGGV